MSFLTYDTADDIITSLKIIEKLLFPETDFWRNKYLNKLHSSHTLFQNKKPSETTYPNISDILFQVT